MAQGQGRSSKQGVKLLYIRDYLYTHTNKDNPKNAKDMVKYLASKGIAATQKTIYKRYSPPPNRLRRSSRIQSQEMGLLHHKAPIRASRTAVDG